MGGQSVVRASIRFAQARLVTALLAVVLAASVGVAPTSAVAAATTYEATAYAYGTATYIYDGPVRLSSPDTVATDARGSPSGPGAACWVSPVSVRYVVVATNTGSRFGSLTHSSSGIAPYSVQRTVTAGQGGSIQAHHLIERRFADVMGQTVGDMPSVVVTRAEHQVFTNAWREAISYGPNGTGMATRAQVEGAAQQIYREYPEILQALGLG